ncbi:hypothetical protein ACEPAG_6060 [Sanghuangporus baumii]
MSVTPREVGTLVVVILKAQHLPNKQRIGKQDPYCCITLNGEKRRTRAIKRGGQHPEWDEEVRFTLFEDTEDILARSTSASASESSSSLATSNSTISEGGVGTTTPPLPPPKEKEGGRKRKKVKGGNVMHVACFADDPKEPELIGETMVDLTEVLTKGETDEWFVLSNKDKFSGEVYLELTFWSNEKPPEKKNKSALMKPNKQYGGPGSFVPSESDSSFGSVDSRSSIPSSLHTASSLAQLDLYHPPYEQTIRSQSTGRTLDQLADEFGGLNVGHERRRESYPPPQTGYTPRPSNSTYSSFSSSNSYHSNGYGSEDYDSGFDNPATPVPRSQHHRSSFGEPGQPIPIYQSPYETNTVHSTGYPVRARSASSMYSVPSASSGFTTVTTSIPSGYGPNTTPTPSGFAPVQTGTPAPSGFMPPPAQTPVPTGYLPQPTQTPVQYGYGPPQAHTPESSGFAPPTSAMGYHQPPSAPVQTYSAYQQYPPAGPASAPPMSYPSGQMSAFPTPPHSAPPQQYTSAPSPPHTSVVQQQYPNTYPPKTPSPPQQYQAPTPVQTTPGSRPLPMPGQKNGMNPVTPPHIPMTASQHGGSPVHSGQFMYANTPPHAHQVQPYQHAEGQPPQQSHPLPAPPGPASQLPANATGPHSVMHQHQQNGFVPPPPPPPLSNKLPGPPPLPPVQVYHQQNASDPSNGHGNSPIRPPLPQPPMSANGNTYFNGPSPQHQPPPGPSMQGSSVFHPPPPPPPLPNRRVVSTPHHPLPQPPATAPPMPAIPSILPQRSVHPGEIFNPGPPPRPPVQVGYEIWHPSQTQ